MNAEIFITNLPDIHSFLLLSKDEWDVIDLPSLAINMLNLTNQNYFVWNVLIIFLLLAILSYVLRMVKHIDADNFAKKGQKVILAVIGLAVSWNLLISTMLLINMKTDMDLWMNDCYQVSDKVKDKNFDSLLETTIILNDEMFLVAEPSTKYPYDVVLSLHKKEKPSDPPFLSFEVENDNNKSKVVTVYRHYTENNIKEVVFP